MTKTQVTVKVLEALERVRFVNVNPNLTRIVRVFEKPNGQPVAEVEVHNTVTGFWAGCFVNLETGNLFHNFEEDEEDEE